MVDLGSASGCLSWPVLWPLYTENADVRYGGSGNAQAQGPSPAK